jgi:hypothetical protein
MFGDETSWKTEKCNKLGHREVAYENMNWSEQSSSVADLCTDSDEFFEFIT